jgi:hypothetical protein
VTKHLTEVLLVPQIGIYHGGLVFFGNPDQALDRFTRIVTATLEDYGNSVERQSILDASQARVVASQYLVKLTLREAPDAIFEIKMNNKSLQRLEISLCPAASDRDDKDISELMLVVMLYRMVDVFATRSIEWLDAGTVLTIDEFLTAFTNVSPRRVRGRQEVLEAGDAPFVSVDDTEQGLAQRYDALAEQVDQDAAYDLVDLTDEETLALAYRFSPRPEDKNAFTPEELAQNDIRRLATWGMTGMVAFLSAPVALSLAAVNLARGEDFRLNTNVLSLTGLLVMLQSTGALASAVSYLPL